MSKNVIIIFLQAYNYIESKNKEETIIHSIVVENKTINEDFQEILNYSHFWNWLPDWNIVKDIYNEFPDSYSVLTPFAYTYLEELIRTTTSDYGIRLSENTNKPIGMKLINLAIRENNDVEYLKLLEEYNIPIEGKNAVIIGRSNIVGKPMLHCLLNRNATVTICHSKTKNLEEITRQADILLVAIGKPEFVTAKMVKEGATVIDIGINRNEEGKLVGDVKFDEVSQKVQYISPVPGGVGPMTIAMLMANVVKAAKNN